MRSLIAPWIFRSRDFVERSLSLVTVDCFRLNQNFEETIATVEITGRSL